MPASEAQRRASKKWNDNNKERCAKNKSEWVANNRERHNEKSKMRMRWRYEVLTEFKIFRRILLDL